MAPPDLRLLNALRTRQLITPAEEVLLQSPAVSALAPRAQLDYLRANRRAGYFITLLAGGLRLVLLSGALLALAGLIVSGRFPLPGWVAIVICVANVGVVVWLARPLIARLNALKAPLPDFLEIM